MFELFSHPYQGNFIALADELTARWYRSLAGRVVSAGQESGLPPIALATAGEDDAAAGLATRFWRPESAAVQLQLSTLRHAAREWSWFGAQLQLAEYLSGRLDRFDAEVLEPIVPLAVAGHVISGDCLQIAARPEELRITTDGGETLLQLTRFQRPGRAPVWARRESDVFDIGSAFHGVFSTADWIPYWNAGSTIGPVSATATEHRNRIEEAAALLESHALEFYLWFGIVLKEVSILDDQGADRSISCSFTYWPSHIHFSKSSLVQTVIVLIHECSHQYFYLLAMFASLVKPGAPEAYSVLRQTMRPLEKVLLGFHSFANVLLALARLRAANAPLPADELAAQLKIVEETVRSLDDGLRAHASAYLEPAGKAIYLSLRSELKAAGYALGDVAGN